MFGPGSFLFSESNSSNFFYMGTGLVFKTASYTSIWGDEKIF